MGDVPTPCPDCDPHGFDANLETFYGPPVITMTGVKIYADRRVGNGLLSPPIIEAKAFARAFCPKHGKADTETR